MKKLILKALRAAGIQAIRLRTSAGKTSMVSFKNLKSANDHMFLALVKNSHIKGKDIFFYIENQSDFIQGVHATGRFYEEPELAIIERHFVSGSVFVDVGANVGNHSLYVAKFLSPKKVIAFEPTEEASRILRCNIALNDLNGQIIHHQVGLSESHGKAFIAEYHTSNLGATRLRRGEGTLKLVSGDSVLASDEVGFIKIDTEGMEMNVLAGLRSTIARCRPVLFVEVEDTSEGVFNAFLGDVGYTIAQKVKDNDVYANYLAVPIS